MDKKIAPTIVVILVIFFILVQAGVLVFALSREGLGIFWTIILILAPLFVIAALVAVYIERIKEIDEEKKDDLSKY